MTDKQVDQNKPDKLTRYLDDIQPHLNAALAYSKEFRLTGSADAVKSLVFEAKEYVKKMEDL